jgi:hypothetical protein
LRAHAPNGEARRGDAGRASFGDISRILFPLSRVAIIYLARFSERPAPLWRRFRRFASAKVVRGATNTQGLISRFRGKIGQATRSSVLSCTAWGFSCNPAYAQVRWALTPPFQPCPAPLWVQPDGSQIQSPVQPQGGAGWYIFCDTVRHSGLASRIPSLSRGMLPFGVRTFLWRKKCCTSDCLSHSKCITRKGVECDYCIES